jgi:hypothetical protein
LLFNGLYITGCVRHVEGIWSIGYEVLFLDEEVLQGFALHPKIKLKD